MIDKGSISHPYNQPLFTIQICWGYIYIEVTKVK